MLKNDKNIKFNKTEMQLLAIIALLIVAITFIFSIATMPKVFADSGFTEIGYSNFDNTDVMTDLTTAENFDINQYPINKKLDTFIVQNFVEYCYSFDESNRKNYGLYLYLYNPSLINLDIASYDNKIQLAVGYNSEGKPNNYEKFNLKFCSVSDGDYKRLFYKFKVVDHRSSHDQLTIAERVNSNARRYDVSGVELLTNGSFLAVDYPVNKSYVYSGYAVGCGIDGNNVESTLNCKPEKLTTLSLEVEHTYFRTLTSDKGADYQNQIDTVYFAVPKEYFENDAKLQRIKAEWYEYLTKEIVVTSNQEFFDKAISYVSKWLGQYEAINHPITGTTYKNTSFNEYLNYGLGQYLVPESFGDYRCDYCWNAPIWLHGYYPQNKLLYLLDCPSLENYDPYSDKTDDEFKNKLYKYILTYTKSYQNGRLPIKNGSISADLFEPDIDNDRKVNNEFGKIQNGYCCYDFDADLDVKYLNSWASTDPKFSDNLKKYGLWKSLKGNIPQEEAIQLKPIEMFSYEDLHLSEQEIVKKYYINAKDVESFKRYATKAQSEDKKVVMFRFATSNYYNTALDIVKNNSGITGVIYGGEAYIAKQSVFFNFDIIQLTFKQGDIFTVIPVVSSPIDIVDDPTPPINIEDHQDPKDIFKIIFTWILIIVGLLIVIKIIAWIFNHLSQKQKVVIKTDTTGKAKRKKHRHKE